VDDPASDQPLPDPVGDGPDELAIVGCVTNTASRSRRRARGWDGSIVPGSGQRNLGAAIWPVGLSQRATSRG
jgi:hypothetical protein